MVQVVVQRYMFIGIKTRPGWGDSEICICALLFMSVPVWASLPDLSQPQFPHK